MDGFPGEGNDYLAVVSSGKGFYTLDVIPQANVEEIIRKAAPSAQISAPYAAGIVHVAGRSFPAVAPRSQVLATADNGNPGESSLPILVAEILVRPDSLYAQARMRTLWFAALIAVSTAAALIGFVSAYCGFRQQCRLNEMKSDFVSSVSHELRAPIASMHLMAESLERGKITEAARQKEYYGLMAQETRRLAMLIENILDFSRIERGGKKYQIEPANLNALARDTVRVMQHSATERQVQLDLRALAAEKADSVPCDALAIQQALVNLIDNAIKHSPAGGRVSIGVENGGTDISLWVEDHGAGIPREDHEKIFERFYRRGSELRRETQGIGIGLAIVKHIVDGHRGRITVRSAPGEGSRFTIELPGEYEH